MWIYDIDGQLWREARRLTSGRVTLVPCDGNGETTAEGYVRVVWSEQLRTLKRALIKNK